jgi:nucleotide-binding universal stress UspA family protein
MNLKRILVAINSLNSRDAAFERALAIARSSGAELYLLHAVPASQRFSFRAVERLDRMAEMRQRAEDAGVRVQTVEQHGDPGATIDLHANARAVDLIVMGGEARRGWGRRRRSVVAQQVIRRTSVPTLVVAGDAAEPPTAFRSVLVAVDLSPASKDVLEGAIGLTADEAVTLTVMHAFKGGDEAAAVRRPSRWMGPEYRNHGLEDARRTLEAVVADVPVGVDARVHVSTGSAARTILANAAEMDADLVVVGRSRGFKMLGSTALRVLHKNDRALLVIPTVTHRRVEQQRAA